VTHDEAMKLMAGYATNSLTDEERKALLAAALDDQEVFDALEQEQALKDVFDDRVARAEIRRALETPPSLRWWTRPWAWGGAGAAVAAMALLAIWSGREHPKAIEIAQVTKAEEHRAEAAVGAPQALDIKPAAPLRARVQEPAKTKKESAAAPPAVAKDSAVREDRARSASEIQVNAPARPEQNAILKELQTASPAPQPAVSGMLAGAGGAQDQLGRAPGSMGALAMRKASSQAALSYTLLRRDVAVLPNAVQESDAVRITLIPSYAGVLSVFLVRSGVTSPLREPLNVNAQQSYVVPDAPVIVKAGDVLQLVLTGGLAPYTVTIPLGKP
jgi:hypothetical protein